jgi:hypothetical protein
LSANFAEEGSELFFTYLNRETYQSIDLSSLINYKPEQIIKFYYNSFIELPFESYEALQAATDENGQPDVIATEWQRLMEKDLKCSPDLLSLKDNEFIEQLGPYYYQPTNTRFYFNRKSSSLPLTAADFDLLLQLSRSPVPNQQLHKYNKTRKNAKKVSRSKEELIEDLTMCINSLQEIEILNRHINYLNKFLEMRCAIVEQETSGPQEPERLPEKPQKAPETERTGLNNLIPFTRARQRQTPQSVSDYNHEIKVYYIRYREYEKACDRYKEALENWAILAGPFMDACLKDIEETESNLKAARKILTVYNNIILRSYVHTDYQDIKTLSIFKHYIETGRCLDIQDCMNLFEEERHWTEIKASQERIENTIYFLQNGSEYTRFADQKINEMLSPSTRKEDREKNQ